jgi:RNA methyltransferase, TrmH family
MLTKAALQRLRSLREKKQREALGLFVVEGEKVMGELLAANFHFEEIYVTPAWQPPASVAPEMARSPRPQLITTEEMARASHFPAPSTVLAVGKITPHPWKDGGLNRGLSLALDGVQDAGNVGTLLRVADWFALDRVVLSPDCADLFSQKVINASMGSFARVKVHTLGLESALATIAPATAVLGCDLHGDSVHDLPPLRDAILVIGSEGRGLSDAVRKKITRFVTVPRYGAAESLNAAVAAAIVCDNLRRSHQARTRPTAAQPD